MHSTNGLNEKSPQLVLPMAEPAENLSGDGLHLNNIQKRIDMDMLSRSIPGVIIFAILWPLIFYPLEFHHDNPWYSWGFAFLLALISAIRWWHKRVTHALYERSARLWRMIFSGLSLMQAACWGWLFALSIVEPAFEPVRFVLVLALGGIASGAMSALSPRLGLVLLNISLILVPGIVVSLLLKSDYSMAILISIFLGYLSMLAYRSNREYLRAFEIEIELDRQKKELQRINQIDPLTLIYNRGHFNTTFQFQWNSGIRSQKPQSLLLIDVDHFKSINDRYGHLFGDDCLIYIAQAIHGIAKRKTDLIARFGGEEFAVLLSNTSQKEAEQLAESIRLEIQENPFKQGETLLNATVSIGVACILPNSSISSNQLIDNADKALYAAKNAGRNQVKVYSSVEPALV
ncbi:GGDEF domain-containing protein [Aliikangiella sp. IMCC44653]